MRVVMDGHGYVSIMASGRNGTIYLDRPTRLHAWRRNIAMAFSRDSPVGIGVTCWSGMKRMEPWKSRGSRMPPEGLETGLENA
jgi:hypothetical protein